MALVNADNLQGKKTSHTSKFIHVHVKGLSTTNTDSTWYYSDV